MKIAYGKLGRAMQVDRSDLSNVGGDIEVVNLLDKLIREGHEVHIVGRSQGHRDPLLYDWKYIDQWDKGGVFHGVPRVGNVDRGGGEQFKKYDAFLRDAVMKLPRYDAIFLWLGQHGTSLAPVPGIQKDGTTTPMLNDVVYGHPVALVANILRERDGVRTTWLCPDPRNVIKHRALWHNEQAPVLAQFNTTRNFATWDERVAGGRLGRSSIQYLYSGIELLAIEHIKPTLEGRERRLAAIPDRLCGILTNEGYTNLGHRGRLHLMQAWFKDQDYEIFGTWSEKSQEALNRRISPVEHAHVLHTLQRWRATLTLPATATGWATSKPWECFLAGVVCFRHPDYDTQNHIYGQHMPEELRKFLSPPTSTAFRDRLKQLEDPVLWRHIVSLQWDYLDASRERLKDGYVDIEKQLQAVTV